MKVQTLSHFIILDKRANRIYIPLRPDYTYQCIRHGLPDPHFEFRNHLGQLVLAIPTTDEELDDAEMMLDAYLNGDYHE